MDGRLDQEVAQSDRDAVIWDVVVMLAVVLGWRSKAASINAYLILLHVTTWVHVLVSRNEAPNSYRTIKSSVISCLTIDEIHAFKLFF